MSREGRTIETEDNRTSLGRTIVQFNDNLAADVAAKKLLAHASILAYILKDCCTEFKSLQLSDIANYSIGANAEVGITPVHPNESEDASSSQMLDGNRKVLTESEESSEKNAPTLKFDILFTARNFWCDKQGNIVPNRRFHINVEMQKRANPGYAIVTRATYYCARLLSKQGEDKTALEVYKGLEKVYSIWICPFVAPKRKNSISRYHVAEDCFEDLVKVQEERTHYELAEIIVVRLGREPKATGNQAMDLLNLIFSSLPAEQKLEQMRDAYHITITQEIEEEVRTMSVLFQKVIEDATPEIKRRAIEEATPAIEKKAIEKNTLQILHNMVCNLGLSVERAMEAAGISANDRPYFASQLALF